QGKASWPTIYPQKPFTALSRASQSMVYRKVADP
ncbi:unnamed protein product, partial [marine sediment metagenome]